MSNRNYLLSIILLFLVCIVQSENSTSSSTDDVTTFELTTSDMTIFHSTTEETSTFQSTSDNMTPEESNHSITTNSFTTHNSTDISTLTVTDETKDSSMIFVSTVDSNINHSTTSHTSITSTTTTLLLGTNITATYRYIVESEFLLKTGTINNTEAMNSVQEVVNASFILVDFDIKVQQIVIVPQAKIASHEYNMLVYILFTSSHYDCNTICIYNATSTPMINVSLPLENGTMTIVYLKSGPLLETDPTTTTTTTTPPPIVNYIIGGPSPGIPAQLGMGLGISIIGVLLIAEIIFLYKKYGLSYLSRRENYAMTDYS